MVAFIIRWRIQILTTLGVLLTTAVAIGSGYMSYGHIVEVAQRSGEPAAAWIPICIDGMMLTGAVMAAVDRLRGYRTRIWASIDLAFGSLATLAFNVASAWERGPWGMAIAAAPAVSLLFSVETLFRPGRKLITVVQDAVKQVVATVESVAAIAPAQPDGTLIPAFQAPDVADETATVDETPAETSKPARPPRKRKPRRVTPIAQAAPRGAEISFSQEEQEVVTVG